MDESRFVKLAQKYKKEYEKFGDDGRKIIVGDNYLDVDDRVYGNNVLLTSDAMVGTMMAGVITGSRIYCGLRTVGCYDIRLNSIGRASGFLEIECYFSRYDRGKYRVDGRFISPRADRTA